MQRVQRIGDDPETAEISAAEMAERANCSMGRIRRLRETGIIPSTKIGVRKYITLRADFEAYLTGEKTVDIDYDLLADKVAAALCRRLAVQLVVNNGDGIGLARKTLKLV